jgi:TRAP-type C4-dicarboxylate transport system substrate-binding protein
LSKLNVRQASSHQRLALLLLITGAALLASMLPALAQTPPLIKLGTAAPDGSSWHQILKEMGQKWKEAPGGGVRLRIYPGSVLGDEPDMVRKMRVGQIHAAALTAAGLSDIDPAVAALQIPMMFDSYEELDFVRGKLRSVLERRLEQKGFIVLNWGDAGWVHFFAKKPFSRPEDLKGRKLFVWAGDTHAVDLWKAAGFRPVPLAATDILPGLQTGLIDAFDVPPLVALANQWFGLAPHMLDLNWAPLIGATVVSKRAWNKIPQASRAAVMKAAEEAGERFRGEIRTADAAAILAMQKHGLIVHPAGPEVVAAWRKAAEEVYPRIRGTIVPADIFDQVRKLRDEFRSSSGNAAP